MPVYFGNDIILSILHKGVNIATMRLGEATVVLTEGGTPSPSPTPTPTPSPTLAALTLSNASIIESAAAGTVVGTVQSLTTGSTWALQDDAGGRFAKSGNNVVTGLTGLDYETSTSHNITIRETLAGATNTPRDTVLAITVTNDAADDGVTPASEIPWTPLMAAPRAWYTVTVPSSIKKGDASAAGDNDEVWTWEDQSGNGLHLNNMGTSAAAGVSANAPLYNKTGSALLNTHKPIAFTGTGTGAQRLGTALNALTLGSAAGGYFFSVVSLGDAAATHYIINHSGSQFNNILSADAAQVEAWTTSGDFGAYTANDPMMLGAQRPVGGTSGNGRFNGAETLGTSAIPAAITNGRMLVGNRLGGASGRSAQHYDHVVFQSLPSRANQQRLEGWAAHKYGLTAKLPADHPYKNAPPMVPTGTTSTVNWPDINPLDEEQTFDGFEIELQNLAYEYPVTGGPGSVSDTQVGGLLKELTTSERTRFATDLLGYGNGFRAIRWAGGLHQHRARTADGKELQKMYHAGTLTGTQVADSEDEDTLLLNAISASGKAIEIWYEEWGSGHFWKTSGVFNEAGTINYPDPVADPTGYAAYVTAFATAFFNNMKRVDQAGFKITRNRFFNEVGNLSQGYYPHNEFSSAVTNDVNFFVDFVEEVIALCDAHTWTNTTAAAIRHGAQSYLGANGLGATELAASPSFSRLNDWLMHHITKFAADGQTVTATIGGTSTQKAGRPVNINEHEFFDAVRNALLASSGTITSVSSVNVTGQGANAENYMFANIGLVFLRNLMLNAATTHMLMIHAAKPTYDGDDNLGYVLANWRSTLNGTNNTGYSGFNSLSVGHWDYYPTNWNAVAGFLKYIPWNAKVMFVEKWEVGVGQAVVCFKHPTTGKLIYVAVNRTASAMTVRAFGGIKSDGTNKTFAGRRFTQSARDTVLTSINAQNIDTSVPAYSIEFWTEQ
jgi:hypothetical protein